MDSENRKLRPSGRASSIISDSFQHDVDLRKIQGRYSPSSILLITIISIAAGEIVAMVLVYFQRHLPYYQQVLFDAVVITAIVSPLLYYLSFKPIIQHIQQRYQVEQVLRSRLRIIQYVNTHALDEMLQFALDELESLTGSEAGYFHFVEADQKTINLQMWSTNTLQNMCKVSGVERHYSVEEAGVWADCIRQRKVVVHNDYESLPNRKGLPEGHAPIVREIAVPVMRDEKIVAVLGVGNKPTNYTKGDVEVVSALADFTWDIVKQKQAGDALRVSEEKFRTLVDWTFDWEKWLDPQGRIVYISPSCERITGYSPEDFIKNPDLLARIIHPDDRPSYVEHNRVVHDVSVGPVNIEYRVIARDGSERWIDHICRPLFDADNQYLGRRVSNRDITERKRIEREIREHSQKEAKLTQTIHTIQTDIARDLHDTLGQNISFLRMNLEHLSEVILSDQTALQTKIQNMTKAANESYDLVRAMLAVLQAGNLADPLNLFTRYAEQVAERSSLQIDITSQGNPTHLSHHQLRQLFYIFREALSNIEKHAKAGRASGEFTWSENGLTLAISDNGCGFNPDQIQPSEHYGLKFMRERAELLNGSLNIESAENAGTTLVVRVPYE